MIHLRLQTVKFLIENKDKLTIDILLTALGAFGKTSEMVHKTQENQLYLTLSFLTIQIMDPEHSDSSVEAAGEVIRIMTSDQLYPSYGNYGLQKEALHAFLLVLKDLDIRELSILIGMLGEEIDIKDDDKYPKGKTCGLIVGWIIRPEMKEEQLSNFIEIARMMYDIHDREKSRSLLRSGVYPSSPVL